MAINPRVAARKEAEIAFLKAEDDRLKDLGEKRKKEAAEKSAATKKEDPVLFSEEDREEENEYSTFGSDFLEELEKDEPKYLSPAERRKQKTSDSMFNTYNTGEEWLMSDGDGDLAKGFINNFRSAIGTGVEDLAYLITDYAPWYKPAQNVVEKNTAGKIEEQAQKQFGNAKANGVNGNVVDFLDNTSKNLGYSLLGFKAGDYVEGLSEGFNEYRKLREQGYSIEDATNKSLSKVPLAILSTKADDYIGKNNKVDASFDGTSGIVAKAHTFVPEDNKKFREALNSRNTNDIIITEGQIGKKIKRHHKDYDLNPGKEEDRIKLLNIVDDIIDNAEEIVIGDNWRHQVGHPIFYIKGEDVVVAMENDKKFVTILKGGITNERVKKARGR